MESKSRPFHSRKLSNAGKNAYSGVLSEHRRAGGLNIDYSEIFGNSQNECSIPVLDVSSLEGTFDDLSFKLRKFKPDYDNIFGGFRAHDHDVVVSDKPTRALSSTTPSSQDSDNSSHQYPDALKQFNMSYNKISPKTKDGLDGTKHVTQLNDIPGFTCFIDEPVPEPQMEAEKPKSVPVIVKEGFPGRRPSENGVRKQSKHHTVEPVSEDNISKPFDIDLKLHRSRVSSPSASSTHVANDKNLESCKTDTSENVPPRFFNASIDEEVDASSVASASAAALRKAIENAQESIRIAKESVGRKKKGLRSFSNKTVKNSSDVESKIDDVFPDFMDGKKLFVAKKVIDELNGKILESNKECSLSVQSQVSDKVKDDTIVSSYTRVTGETESIPLDSTVKSECATSFSKGVDSEKIRTVPSDFAQEGKPVNMFVDEFEGKIEVNEPATGRLEDQMVMKEPELVERRYEVEETAEADMSRESNEVKEEVRLRLAHKLFNESHNLTVSKTLENEKHEEVLEQDVDNAENVTRDKGIDEASEWSESENEFKDVDDSEEMSEIFYNVCEVEMEETAQIFDNRFETSEETVHENCETVHEKSEETFQETEGSAQTFETNKESLDNTFDREFEDKSSSLCDNNTMEETEVDEIYETYKVEMNDNNVETTQDVEDALEEEEEFSEKVSIEQTASDDDEDECEVKSDNLPDIGSDDTHFGQSETEENDVQSQSSSGTTPDIGSTSEIKESQEPDILNETKKVDETEVSVEDQTRRIDEMISKKNRLAVDRAIREARERAFAEARERAVRERAAVEKATEEVRQRMMADALEKVAKTSTVTQSSSAKSKLRAERAAVERATLEARQRALEKAISQKNASDLNISESALRTKAKLEKHNRIMERAAKALAEKEKRDLLAQKEQAERHRLAESVDAHIKRWSNGKEKNLRALLSTLQYILGPESGWQPVTLSEIISSSAVKKAYRKATLCVHPDKLQQRGASIQQKYICEKVFDRLQAAWNRFNSEEK